MYLRRKSNGYLIQLDKASVLGGGGEGQIYALPQNPLLVAKVFHEPQDIHHNKLLTMLEYDLHDPMRQQGHTSIAWPVDLLLSQNQKRNVVGYLMPRVNQMRPIFVYFNPASRLRECPLFNYQYLYRTARNLASAMHTLHQAEIIIGDVNESNILVSASALVTLVDTDSFQIIQKNRNQVFRCPVGKPQFTPPELQGKNFSSFDRQPEHDLFGLAVLIFQLLMEGTHPYDGVYQFSGDAPLHESRIAAGHFPYHLTKKCPYKPKPTAPPFEILPAEIQKLFLLCFEEGHRDPKRRPDAQTWRETLSQAEKTLIPCSSNPQHWYGSHLPSCPWCERMRQLGGKDAFPTKESIARGTHRRRKKRPKLPLPPTPGLQTQAAGASLLPGTQPLSQSLQDTGFGCSGGCLVIILIVIWVSLIVAVGMVLVFGRKS